jgi:hypothetical protein
MELALFQPDIAQNTGTIFRARTTSMRHDPGEAPNRPTAENL